jgi:hypothetical protein
MSTRLFVALAGALLVIRLPSLVQPMGPDQGLYAYVGERILHGELAYRDAWDQKPPGIHYLYAGLRYVWPGDAAVPAADLMAAAIATAVLWALGTRLGGPAAGGIAGVLFLLLSDPSFGRYGGVRVRAQCETFIALLTAGALLLAITDQPGWRRTARLFASGVLLGGVFALKYNAGLYGAVVLFAVALTSGLTLRDMLTLLVGACVIPAMLFAVFLAGGALRDLFQATIVYNLHYSGETYAGPLQLGSYLLRFPVDHARVDALWFIGGLGCIVLLVAGVSNRAAWVPVVWVAGACLSIAINGSRGLPQYFLQAAPALALAAGLAAPLVLPRMPRLLAWTVVALVAVGVWRVNDFPKLASNTWHDVRYVTGEIDWRTHRARYGGQREVDKYSALDNADLGAMIAQRSRPDDTVYVFGFSPGAYLYAGRRSASRFFWSRPVILNFNGQDPRYGVAGLLDDLQRTRPAIVVLQHHDWAPDVEDSAPFFLSQASLAAFLRGGYHEVPAIEGFVAWERNDR